MAGVAKDIVHTTVVLLHGWNGTTEEPWIQQMRERLAVPGIRVVVPKSKQTCVTMMFGEQEVKTRADAAWFEVDFRDNPSKFPGTEDWQKHVDAYGLHGRREFSIFQKKWKGLDISLYDIMREARSADYDHVNKQDGIAQVVVVGHSMGAFVALYASSLPTTHYSEWPPGVRPPAEEEWNDHCKYMQERLYAVVAMHGLYPLTAPGIGAPKVFTLLTSHVGESETMFKFTMSLMLSSVTELIQLEGPHLKEFVAKNPLAAKELGHGPTGPEIDRVVKFVRNVYTEQDEPDGE